MAKTGTTGKQTERKVADPSSERKRKYLSQADVPSFSLTKALSVPQAIADNYAKVPTRPLRVAEALNMQPLSSTFRVLTGAAIAYGVTEGGYNAETIAITALGKRIVAPSTEGDDLAGKREALMHPRVIREFLTKYNGSRLPPDNIARNVLEEMGVPRERVVATLELIVESAREVGFVRELKGHLYFDLEGTPIGDSALTPAVESEPEPGNGKRLSDNITVVGATQPATLTTAALTNNRVFITHGKNKEIVSQLKELLTFGGFQPIVSVEQETVSKPVPDKVMDHMRSCAAAIIHVGTEMRLLDDAGEVHRILNPNVLIEIGGAMALYGRKFILLVERGVELPSNLQGLYEVRYEGERLDYEATMRLLKAFNDFRR